MLFFVGADVGAVRAFLRTARKASQVRKEAKVGSVRIDRVIGVANATAPEAVKSGIELIGEGWREDVRVPG